MFKLPTFVMVRFSITKVFRNLIYVFDYNTSNTLNEIVSLIFLAFAWLSVIEIRKTRLICKGIHLNDSFGLSGKSVANLTTSSPTYIFSCIHCVIASK